MSKYTYIHFIQNMLQITGAQWGQSHNYFIIIIRASSQYKVFPRYGILMLKIRWSRDHLVFNMRILTLVKQHLYIETAPRIPIPVRQHIYIESFPRLNVIPTGLGSIHELNSFVYTSGHWRSRMEVKIMAGSLFVHCKIAYFYSVTAEKWLVVSLPNFVMIRMTHLPISCKIFSWIRATKLKIHAMEFCDFIKDSVSLSGLFVPCSLTVTSMWRPRLTAHCPIGECH